MVRDLRTQNWLVLNGLLHGCNPAKEVLVLTRKIPKARGSSTQ
jgi:hypothetical protein